MSIKIKPGVKLGPNVTVKVPILETPHTLTISNEGTGVGLVVSLAGVNGEGQYTFDYGTEVTLTAAAAPGSIFTGWGGDATGTGPAVLTMDAERTVTATFDRHAALVAIDITPLNPAIARGGSMQLNAIGTFADAQQADLTNRVTWTSSNQVIATVSETGLVTGQAGGAVSIHAFLNYVDGVTTLHVSP